MAYRFLKNIIAIILVLFVGVDVYFLYLHLVSVSADTPEIEYKVNSDHLLYRIDKITILD